MKPEQIPGTVILAVGAACAVARLITDRQEREWLRRTAGGGPPAVTLQRR